MASQAPPPPSAFPFPAGPGTPETTSTVSTTAPSNLEVGNIQQKSSETTSKPANHLPRLQSSPLLHLLRSQQRLSLPLQSLLALSLQRLHLLLILRLLSRFLPRQR
jgi:hypothetical protein